MVVVTLLVLGFTLIGLQAPLAQGSGFIALGLAADAARVLLGPMLRTIIGGYYRSGQTPD